MGVMNASDSPRIAGDKIGSIWHHNWITVGHCQRIRFSYAAIVNAKVINQNKDTIGKKEKGYHLSLLNT